MRLRAAILSLSFLLATSAAAHADTYCVVKTGCDHDAGSDLQLALNEAAAHPGEDTVKIGGVLNFSAAGGFTYASSDAVHIEGDGGVAYGHGGTTLSDSTANPSSEAVLRVSGTAARKKHQSATATATACDGNGRAKTTTAKLTLLAPR